MSDVEILILLCLYIASSVAVLNGYMKWSANNYTMQATWYGLVIDIFVMHILTFSGMFALIGAVCIAFNLIGLL
ncbi:hypothetical protein PP-LIT1_gp11 [Pseudomonas phage LIT1]|uniref:Uncharacterized protein n=2 Tax=Litunavirus LIT1 TaxID=1920763 RepID=C8ZKM5_9CAUD|nr:hypothetical protein PP-LIT1_gp11 [Pseudomonas phage LIT1]YP_009206284.1 hypothetical protein AVU25_gp75 [Pseudomonas phage DL64]AKF14045.1 hypothetical protein [Pseudomonas phage DL64]CAZ66267.1 hypothetical protein [Pseudomonas phage LIT1]